MILKNLGNQDYLTTYHKMQEFTKNRDKHTNDELWYVSHNPVFTQGLAGNKKHLLHNSDNIPVIKTDRGGQITYHGPGQIIIYCLIDIKRLNLAVREMVTKIEDSIIKLLNDYDIKGSRLDKAPGVYINGAKIAALGLKIHKGKSYHGLSLNVDMDLQAFSMINPCGYKNLKVTQMKDLTNKHLNYDDIVKSLANYLVRNFYG